MLSFSYKPIVVSNLALPSWKWFTFVFLLVMLRISPHSAYVPQTNTALLLDVPMPLMRWGNS
jgi:hypothetical protein